MSNPDLLLYVVHVLFWTAFGITNYLMRDAAATLDPMGTSETVEATVAPNSRSLLAFHMLAFGVMYFGIGNAVIPSRVPEWFASQRIAGAFVIALGAALMCWARAWFHSWRFRAKLDAGHRLATGGPFALIRHPIYAGLTLLAIGSAIWTPTVILWISVVMMAIGGDLRGRAEEQLLERAFGDEYRTYKERTKRFVQGIY